MVCKGSDYFLSSKPSMPNVFHPYDFTDNVGRSTAVVVTDNVPRGSASSVVYRLARSGVRLESLEKAVLERDD